jgi:glycosyltransferase involved in cell wall biosynthesis
MSTKLRIALLSFDFGEYSAALARGLAERHEVGLFLPQEQSELAGLRSDDGVDLVAFEKPRLRQPVKQLRMCRRLLSAIRQYAPDVVHVQGGHLWFNLALPLLRRRYPLVITVHDVTRHPGDAPSGKTPQAVMDLSLRFADQLVVHAERLKRKLVEGRRLDARGIHVVPIVAIGAEQATAGSVDGPPQILFFGRIWPYKGLEYLIRAEPLISAAVAEARFVIAGEGEDFERYRRLMTDPARFVVHNEFLSNEERNRLFAHAAVVVLPYVEASQSAVVPLACAFGKPVVVTDVGGLPEAVEHERTGLVVPPRDERALAGAVVRLLRDQGLRLRLGEAGRHKLESEWSPAAVAERTARVYELAVNGRGTRRFRGGAGALDERSWATR